MKHLILGLWLVVASSGLAAQGSLSDGEVSKVDSTGGRLTLKHSDIKHLDLPPMTMVYRVSDPAMLARLQVGDKIRFRAEKIDGRYTVTRIEVVK